MPQEPERKQAQPAWGCRLAACPLAQGPRVDWAALTSPRPEAGTWLRHPQLYPIRLRFGHGAWQPHAPDSYAGPLAAGMYEEGRRAACSDTRPGLRRAQLGAWHLAACHSAGSGSDTQPGRAALSAKSTSTSDGGDDEVSVSWPSETMSFVHDSHAKDDSSTVRLTSP